MTYRSTPPPTVTDVQARTMEQAARMDNMEAAITAEFARVYTAIGELSKQATAIAQTLDELATLVRLDNAFPGARAA